MLSNIWMKQTYFRHFNQLHGENLVEIGNKPSTRWPMAIHAMVRKVDFMNCCTSLNDIALDWLTIGKIFEQPNCTVCKTNNSGWCKTLTRLKIHSLISIINRVSKIDQMSDTWYDSPNSEYSAKLWVHFGATIRGFEFSKQKSGLGRFRGKKVSTKSTHSPYLCFTRDMRTGTFTQLPHSEWIYADVVVLWFNWEASAQ